MKDYVVCENRGNHPRIHVKICEHRCEKSDTCHAFKDFVKARADGELTMKPETNVLSAGKNVLPAPVLI
jgi:hypothetical protein